MEFWLKFKNNAEKLQLPVNPSEFTVSKGNQNQTVSINDAGEINLIGKTGLASISLGSFFPAREYSFCQYSGFPDPYDCVQLVESWRLSGEPIRLIISDANTDLVNLAMAIETFEYGEKGGTRDVYYTLELKEYRFLNIENAPQGSEPRAVSRSVPREYVVQSGDTLWEIARRLTGDGGNFQNIAAKNNIIDPNMIYSGQRLVIE